MTPPTLNAVWSLFMEWLKAAPGWQLVLGGVTTLPLAALAWFKRTRIIAIIIGGLAVWGVFVMMMRGVVKLVVRDVNGGWMGALVLLVTAGLAVVTVARVAYPPEDPPK